MVSNLKTICVGSIRKTLADVRETQSALSERSAEVVLRIMAKSKESR